MFPMVIKNFISPEEAKILTDFLDPISKPSPRVGIATALGFRSSLMAKAAGITDPVLEGFSSTNEKEILANELLNSVFNKVRDKFGEIFNVTPALTQGVYQIMTTGGDNPLHSDSTNLDGSPLQPDGTPEELEWSGLLYLNTSGVDFDGGIIYFPKQNLEISTEVGDLLVFPGDVEHVHGVTPVTRGERKNLVFFYGRDENVGTDRNFFDLDNFSPENYEKYGKDANVNNI